MQEIFAMNIEVIWENICSNEGEIFHQIKGQEFTYKVKGNAIKLSTTNYNIAKSTFEKALEFVPLENTVPVQHLSAPSYLYAILMDRRIRANEY